MILVYVQVGIVMNTRHDPDVSFRIGVLLLGSFKSLETGSLNCLLLLFLNIKSQRVSSSKQNNAGQHGVFYIKPTDVFTATSLLGLKQ